MKPITDVQLAMILLSAIVFVRPSRSYILTMMKILMFHYVLGALLLLFLWLISRRWTKPVIVFSNFTIV
ncbi:MAG: hypothetical protein NTY07_13325 [Bacteroidia bacterium]|nr:hypothetical protein [Bacteroidia bacterium]